MKKLLCLLVTLSAVLSVQAAVTEDQKLAAVEAQIALVREVANTERTAVVAQNVSFTAIEAEAFWPLYRQYRAEFQKIGDGGLALIKDFAKNYNSMSDEKATELTDQALQLEQQRVKLKKSYAKKFRKVVQPAKVFRVFQVENRINAVNRLKLAAEIPLMK
ncbi:hypothetical protein A9Q89_01550 [Gammaproteobacteria bacterium 53_120_T64]|nr:hypothetical protein A9Q89_01550 [Gammaproteobacteria bacterium 53_120_T64]